MSTHRSYTPLARSACAMPAARLILGMSYAIMRTAKLSSWAAVGASGAHAYRTIPTPNAAPDRARLNRTLVGTKGGVSEDVTERVMQVAPKPRSNAVLAVELLLTASADWFEGKTNAEVNAWVQANGRWLRETFGSQNVVHAVLHRDESTPHICAYVVPEVAGRLNARALLGGRAKMRDLQTSYAAAMMPFGLQRGIEGSQATHQAVRTWYGQVETTAAEVEKRLVEVEAPDPPPHVPVWKGQEARQEALRTWQGGEKRKRKQLVQEAAVAALAATTAQRQVEDLRRANGKLETEVIELRRRLGEAYDALGLGKEDIAALRRCNTSLVATRLGHTGPIGPKENAIDLVRRVGEFDYGQAVAWLHSEFGSTVAGAAVKVAIEQENPPRPLTPAERTVGRIVRQQLDALDAGRYRISLVPPGDGAKPFLPGKRGSEERFYTRDEVVGLVPFLRWQNGQGMNVYVTPMDDEQTFILLDDVRMTEAEMAERGFTPCLYQASSWDKRQAVCKVPRELDRKAAMAVFNELNRAHGDQRITGLRHPFRLAGFRNMQPKHLRAGQYPLVRIYTAVNTMCQRCIDLVRQVEKAAVINISTGPKYKQ